MKFVLFFVIVATSLILENRAQKIVECKTGNVTIAKKDELAKVFLAEYQSKSNYAWNAFTGNWFSHLTRLGEYTQFGLCDCISSKSNPLKNASIVYSAELTTIEKARLDFSYLNIKSSTPLVNCVMNNEDFFMMEGYRSNGLKNSMDIYLLKIADNSVPGGKYPVKFVSLVQSVEIPSCHICFG